MEREITRATVATEIPINPRAYLPLPGPPAFPANSNFLIARQIFYRVSAVAPSLNVFEEIKSHGNISKFSSANRECETLWKMKELIEKVILTVG